MMIIEVILWNELIGVLIWDESTQTTSFEYSKEFIKKGISVSPLVNPTTKKIIHARNKEQKEPNFDTNKGLPLFISDSLPDKFGTELFSKYLEKKGVNFQNLTPIEKLMYVGNRGMGALEYKPSKTETGNHKRIDIMELNQLSNSLLNDKPIGDLDNLAHLFHVGTSPGGAQPKVLINIDINTKKVYRGDNLPTSSQESWILKFNKDIGQKIDKEKGKIEFAYYLIAKKCNIIIMESKLMEQNGEHFFMTKRFDRKNGEKTHTQTLHAFAGMNFMLPNTYSYEQIFRVFHTVHLDYSAKEQLFRILIFNLIGRNIDDHTKNFGFSMNQEGKWSFSPAYDLTFSYNENYGAISPHFLSVNGKNNNHNLKDILAVAETFSIKKPKRIINEINQAFLSWSNIAKEVGISEETTQYIKEKLTTIPYVLGKIKN